MEPIKYPLDKEVARTSQEVGFGIKTGCMIADYHEESIRLKRIILEIRIMEHKSGKVSA